ncbi:hypothetical protein MFRU_033g00300 [Monilinia fructicola]|uniref:Ketoreductase (KR) domain-containing protein n=1 Tax=Monilinia fructicola TaxID=38448 RepID=A0A5M9KAR9_MONFR|nr:hypothetical protein EYC84_006168 [Monilinia fructicola]KAG4027059.1 hypothetical protein MFRU_033g00300 [Monilinia fructicola]
MGWFTSFLYSQFFITLPTPTHDFTGQTIIVTGSNTGLGLEAARHLSRLNTSLLILAVRNQAKGKAAKESILASTGRPESSIEVWDLDMQSYESIKTFCAKVNTLPRLDAVLANAGIMTKYFKLVEGYESTITTNVIGTFLLAFGLLPKLKRSAEEYKMQPRLSIVTSDLHFIAKFTESQEKDIFAALNDEKTSKLGMERYAVSKIIQVFGARELAHRLTRDSDSISPAVIVNCMTPGACQSEFHRENVGIEKLMGWIMHTIISRTTEVGGRALVASVAAGEESHGSYMADCVVSGVGPLVQGSEGRELQKKVWDQLLRQLETIEPGITSEV